MSKKEIRRAARDAFPKSKGAQKKGSGSKRVATTPQGRNAPKPPSIRRSLIIGAVTAFAFFALIQWVFNLSDTSTGGNVLFAGIAFILYTLVNYLIERMKYRRYLDKSQGSGK